MRQALEACHRAGGFPSSSGSQKPEGNRHPAIQLVTGRGWKGTAFGGARGRTDVPKIVDWYMSGKIEIDPMITHVLKLEDINKGFDLMHQGKSIRFGRRILKHRTQTQEDKPMTVHIHPSIDSGVKQGSGSFTGGTLVCKCKDRPVKSHQGRCRPQPRLRLHQMLEARRAAFSVVAVVRAKM